MSTPSPSRNYRVIVVTNQAVVARGCYSEAAGAAFHTHMKSELAAQGAHIDAIYYCPHPFSEAIAT